MARPAEMFRRVLSAATILAVLFFAIAPADAATLWPTSAVPAVVDAGPDGPVELGVRFRSDTAGTVSGIRFYKAAANTGPHTARLWTAAGQLLATATFTSETASGWQQADFATPVAISAGTDYVASYHVPGGHYSYSQDYFATTLNAPPLHAPADSASTPQGIFGYGPPGTFPSASWNRGNYWVDVVFTPGSGGGGSGGGTATGASLWPASSVPAVIDGGPDSPVELGVRFRSETSGTIAGIRFYKSSANTGTHTAHLWSAGGQLLATATFSGETASGWQQADFPVPVAINGATDYIASYHVPAGHYSYSPDYFAAARNAPPLTAPADSGSAPNGVFGYGPSGTFPSSGWSRSNYWVDVVFVAGSGGGSTPSTGATLWPSTAVPAVVDEGPDNPVELGVRFRSDVSGTISGIRFYKAAANSGPHTARLWTAAGQILATATFTGESASGWQQADFPAPVTISANTTYIASYHVPAGHYSGSSGYFAAPRDAAPLHAPADGTAGPNGVFAYGPPGSFPVTGYNSGNYWVDVVFQAAAGGDTTPPQVTSFVLPGSSTSLTVGISSFAATDNVGVVGYLVTESATPPSPSGNGWSTQPPGSYSFATPGSKTLYAWARDAAGNVSASRSASVSVSSQQTGGGALLLVTSSQNTFSGYYGEILRTEGFNGFNQTDINDLSSTLLSAHDLVVLGEMPLTSAQVSMLEAWVNGGGRLIAMRPDKKLAPLLGLRDQSAALSNGYLLVNNSTAAGSGITGQTMQFHGTADIYSIESATSVARLYSNASSDTGMPAVVLRSVGPNGGQAAAFTYDLARSVIYTRQGNPAWAGQERDGDNIIRSDDLFYGPAAFDPQPNWVDLGKVAIPQADEQQRLLANLIIRMNLDRKPLPRFWYLPRGLTAAVVMTGDDHGNGSGGTLGRFEAYQYMSSPGCSVEDWGCIRGSSYLFVTNSITNDQAAYLNASGFEIALHLNTNCANWTPSSLDYFYTSQLNDFGARFPGVPRPVTNRTHCIAWSDYVSQPWAELAHGIRLDTSYYYWPAHWVSNNPGFFTGSGIPMRFADQAGRTIDVYQAPTQMTDESGQSFPYTSDVLLDRATGPEGYYGVFVVNAHTDTVSSSVSDAVIGSARQRGVPVISSRQLLTWLDGRNNSSFGSISWNGTTLSFTVSPGNGARGLTVMVPVSSAATVSGVLRNGSPLSYDMTTVKGVKYARFEAEGGNYQVTYGSDSTAPRVIDMAPSRGAVDVGLAPQISARFSEPVELGTLQGGGFALRDPAGVSVPASVDYIPSNNTAVLRPNGSLYPRTTYTAVIDGVVRDYSGNQMGSGVSWSFTTGSTGGMTSIWSSGTTPANTDAGADSPVELGVKFRSDRPGYITGIRFYKSGANTGSHTGRLWSADGKLLATATFSQESSSGWQQASFPNPVAISPNTVYIASYHATGGHYSYDPGYFFGRGADSPPLHAIPEGEYGSNGVFAYGPAGSFPNQAYNGTNYWVDVVFSDEYTAM